MRGSEKSLHCDALGAMNRDGPNSRGRGLQAARSPRNMARDASGCRNRGLRLSGLEDNLPALHPLWLDLIVSAGKD